MGEKTPRIGKTPIIFSLRTSELTNINKKKKKKEKKRCDSVLCGFTKAFCAQRKKSSFFCEKMFQNSDLKK
jgi:hypothetical protein